MNRGRAAILLLATWISEEDADLPEKCRQTVTTPWPSRGMSACSHVDAGDTSVTYSLVPGPLPPPAVPLPPAACARTAGFRYP